MCIRDRRKVGEYNLRSIGHCLRVVQTARPVPCTDELISVRKARPERKHDRVIGSQLIDQAGACRRGVADLPETTNSPKGELIGKGRLRGRAIENRDDAAIEVYIYRLQRIEQPVKESRAVEIKSSRARKIQGDTRARCLRASKPSRKLESG